MWKAFNLLFPLNIPLSEILPPVALDELQNLPKRRAALYASRRMLLGA
jgi:hypothetical protein